MGVQPEAADRPGIVSATQRPCLALPTWPDLGQPVKAGALRHRCAAYGLDRLSPARRRLPIQVRMIGSAEALQCRQGSGGVVLTHWLTFPIARTNPLE